MIYRKNLPGLERAPLPASADRLGTAAVPAAPLGYAIAANGLTAILAGFFGFCPMCSMAGRTPPPA